MFKAILKHLVSLDSSIIMFQGEE